MPPPDNKKKKNKKKRNKSKGHPNDNKNEARKRAASNNSKSTNNNNNRNKKDEKPHQQQRKITQLNNPLLDAYINFMKQKCTSEERDNFFSNTHLDADRRGELWMEQADAGEALVNRYSWAIPDERALRILKHFSPIVEIGCGANAYWCKMATQAGIDMVGYDQHPESGGQIADNNNTKKEKKKKKRQRASNGDEVSFQVRKGGPEVLATKELRNRTLFLCYSDEEALQSTPEVEKEEEEEEAGETSGDDEEVEDEDDEDDNDDDDEDDNDDDDESRMTTLGVECLKNYTGDYVIHVGELFGDSLSLEQCPWGRSSGPEFQQYLATTFHCILKASLPNWIHVRDTISVWKRSETCSIVFAADSDEEDEEGDEEVEYKHIPVSERLPTDFAAPCVSFLLDSSTTSKESGKKTSSNDPATNEQVKQRKMKAADARSNSEDGSEGDSDNGSENQPRKTDKPPAKKAKVEVESSSSDDEEAKDYVVEW